MLTFDPSSYPDYTVFAGQSTADNFIRRAAGTSGERILRAVFGAVREYNDSGHSVTISVADSGREIYLSGYDQPLGNFKERLDEIADHVWGGWQAWEPRFSRLDDGRIRIQLVSRPLEGAAKAYLQRLTRLVRSIKPRSLPNP